MLGQLFVGDVGCEAVVQRSLDASAGNGLRRIRASGRFGRGSQNDSSSCRGGRSGRRDLDLFRVLGRAIPGESDTVRCRGGNVGGDDVARNGDTVARSEHGLIAVRVRGVRLFVQFGLQAFRGNRDSLARSRGGFRDGGDDFELKIGIKQVI